MWDRTYTVPNRFGIRSILLGTALFAVIFTLTKAIDASLRIVAPVMSFVVLVGLAQMAFGQIPRTASCVVGAVLFPLCALIDPYFEGRQKLQVIEVADWFWLMTCGAIAGYIGGVLLAAVFLIADQFRRIRGKTTYAVPRRFGTGTLLLATTLFAIMFAGLQWARARPAELFFFTAFVATVSMAQMIFEYSPRWASIAAGGIYLPLSVVVIPLARGRPIWRGQGSLDLFTWAVIGLFIGYLGGAIVAGVFLLCDYLAKLWSQKRQPVSQSPA